ncbi:MAG: amidohydrolase, partial [Myxococcales bacterium]
METSAESASGERLILANARVRTLLPEIPTAEAVGVAHGRIQAVGTLSEVRAALGRAREIDLAGATVVPGLIDAHGHLAMMGERMRQLDLSGARSPEEVAALVAARAAGAAEGEWLVGRAWDQNRFECGGLPDRACLDRVAPDVPVFLERVDGHAAWANSRALEAGGIGRDSPDPPGGRILRDSAGEPIGILLDAAMKPVTDRLPAPTEAELEARLLAAAARCAGFGLTAVHDAGVDLRTWTVLERLARQGRLPVRVYAMAWRGAASFEELIGSGPRIGLFDGMLTLRAVKFLADGALGSRGAALFEDYCDEPGQKGLLVELDLLERDASRMLRSGFQ